MPATKLEGELEAVTVVFHDFACEPKKRREGEANHNNKSNCLSSKSSPGMRPSFSSN